jgi:hypothetical protein
MLGPDARGPMVKKRAWTGVSTQRPDRIWSPWPTHLELALRDLVMQVLNPQLGRFAVAGAVVIVLVAAVPAGALSSSSSGGPAVVVVLVVLPRVGGLLLRRKR